MDHYRDRKSPTIGRSRRKCGVCQSEFVSTGGVCVTCLNVVRQRIEEGERLDNQG